MTLAVRRVVTGHDEAGKAVVICDEISDNIISRRQGHTSCVIWTNDKTPADNSGRVDDALADVGSGPLPAGAIFRIIEYGPGVAPRDHRTDTIDYAVVLSGEIIMNLDGTEVHLKAGDVLVQRGTVHNWVNNGSEPCVMAFVLISADPVLDAVG
ncbi:MAG: cupin domain-containing protein [Rhodospirillales bacterium]|nr:cupin domain-containing protein [Rhodospirillales bacterium]